MARNNNIKRELEDATDSSAAKRACSNVIKFGKFPDIKIRVFQTEYCVHRSKLSRSPVFKWIFSNKKQYLTEQPLKFEYCNDEDLITISDAELQLPTTCTKTGFECFLCLIYKVPPSSKVELDSRTFCKVALNLNDALISLVSLGMKDLQDTLIFNIETHYSEALLFAYSNIGIAAVVKLICNLTNAITFSTWKRLAFTHLFMWFYKICEECEQRILSAQHESFLLILREVCARLRNNISAENRKKIQNAVSKLSSTENSSSERRVVIKMQKECGNSQISNECFTLKSDASHARLKLCLTTHLRLSDFRVHMCKKNMTMSEYSFFPEKDVASRCESRYHLEKNSHQALYTMEIKDHSEELQYAIVFF